MPAPAWVAFLLLLLPAMQAAVEFINALVPAATRPRALPKLDFSKGIPADCETMVAVPALLLNEQHVHELVMDLEIRYLANRDPQLHFALLSDSVDAVDQAGAATSRWCRWPCRSIEGLNARYGRRRRGRRSICSTGTASTTRPSSGGWDGSASAASCST